METRCGDETMIRRKFLAQMSSLLGTAVVSGEAAARRLSEGLQNAGASDDEVAQKVFAMVAHRGMTGDPIGEIMVSIGSFFIGTPYVAHALEVPGSEHLVVNLRALDCTTFVESVLALSRCVRLGTPTFDAFTHELQRIRYRNGEIRGYPSRLHYFIDWVGDNEKKGIVKNVTRAMGGVTVTKPIDFMTTHRDGYRQLADEENVKAIIPVEQGLSASGFSVIAKQRIAAIQEKLGSGDILGLVTSIKGIDVSHIGLVVRSGRTAHFLHAPLSGGAVQLSEKTLPDYVSGIGKATGIIVARPVNP